MKRASLPPKRLTLCALSIASASVYEVASLIAVTSSSRREGRIMENELSCFVENLHPLGRSGSNGVLSQGFRLPEYPGPVLIAGWAIAFEVTDGVGHLGPSSRRKVPARRGQCQQN